MSETARRPWKYPQTLFMDAVVEYINTGKRDVEARNRFFETVQPLVDYYVTLDTRMKDAAWRATEKDDVVSYVNWKMIKNWFRAFAENEYVCNTKHAVRENTVIMCSLLGWFSRSVWGWVLKYFHEQEPKLEVVGGLDFNDGDPFFIKQVNSRMDRLAVLDSAERLAAFHMSTRVRQGKNIADVVLRVAQYLAQRHYDRTGELIA